MMSVKQLRSITGLSQRAFGEKYHIPKRTVENWESGSRKPSETVLYLLNRVVQEDYMDYMRNIETSLDPYNLILTIQVEDEDFKIHLKGWEGFSQKELMFGILSEVNKGLELPLDDPESRVLFDKLKPIFTV